MSVPSFSEYNLQSREEVLHGFKDKHAIIVGFAFMVCAIITVVALRSLPVDPTAGLGTTGNAVAVILGGTALFSAICVGIFAHYKKETAKLEEEKRPELGEELFNQLANHADLSPAYKDLIHRANDETWKDIISRSSDLKKEQREKVFTKLIKVDKEHFLKIQLETLNQEERSAFVSQHYTAQDLSVMSNPTYQATLLALISTAESHEDLQSLEQLIKIDPVRSLDNYFELIENGKLDKTLCEQGAFVRKHYTAQHLSVMSTPTYQAALLALISTAEDHEDLQSLETLIKINPITFLNNYFELIENGKLDEALVDKFLVHLEIALRDENVKSAIKKAFMANKELMIKYFSVINRNWSELSTIASPLLEMAGVLIDPVSFLDTYFEFIATEKLNNINGVNRELHKIFLRNLKKALRDADVKIAIYKSFMESKDLMIKYFTVINRNWSQLSAIAKPLLALATSAGMSPAKLLTHFGNALNPNFRQMINGSK